MRLVVTFANCNLPKQEQERLSLVFRNAMLDYVVSVEKLELYQRKRYFEFNFAVLRGRWACYRYLSIPDRVSLQPYISFEE